MSLSFTTPVARGLTFVTIAAIAWGTGGVVAAILYRDSGLGPIAISFWRTIIGVALLAAGYGWRRRREARDTPARPRATRSRRFLIAAVTGIGLATYQTAYYAGVQASGVAFATVVTLGAGPILIAVGARFATAERLGLIGVAAVATAPVGLLLIVGGTAGNLAGVVFSLISATGYALVTVLHRALGGVDPARTTLHGFIVASVCLAPLAVFEGLLPTQGVAWQTVGMLAYLGAVSTALAYSLFFASLSAVRATTVSMLALAEPLTATAIAVVLLGEHLTWPMVAGSAVLLAAVALLTRAESGLSPA